MNTREDGWKDLKIAMISKRRAGQSATPDEWDTRVLPGATIVLAIAMIATAKVFRRTWRTPLRRLGVSAFATVHALGDGAGWIWKSVNRVLTGCRQTLDIYHACEWLSACAQRIFGEATADSTAAFTHARDLLLRDGWSGVCAWVADLLAVDDVAERERRRKPYSASPHPQRPCQTISPRARVRDCSRSGRGGPRRFGRLPASEGWPLLPSRVGCQEGWREIPLHRSRLPPILPYRHQGTPMTATEKIAATYLRLNGFCLLPHFTTFGFDSHCHCDLIGLRAANSQEVVGGEPQGIDNELFRRLDSQLCDNARARHVAVVAEVKTNNERPDVDDYHLAYVKNFFGAIEPIWISFYERQRLSRPGLTISILIEHAWTWILPRIDSMQARNWRYTKEGSWTLSEAFLADILVRRRKGFLCPPRVPA